MNNKLARLNNSLQTNPLARIPLVLFLIGFSLDTMAQSVGCNDSFVAMDANALIINVTPNGSDDTTNIQCALDAAVSEGIPTVALSAGNFFISNLIVEGFKGTLEGKTKTTTVVEGLDNSVDCVGMANAGQSSSVIKFVNGEPRIRFLTLRANDVCMQNNVRASNFLHFTGEAANVSNCKNDVIFAAVDRVIIDGTATDTGPFVAVSVWPEGDGLGGCKTTLLGTFKLNRSELFNTLFGLMTTMKGGAQVDVNFNEFHNHQIAVYLLNTNQNTTVSTNKFFSTTTIEGLFNGVSITTLSPTAPATTRAVVHNNTFNVASTAGGPSIAVTALQDGRVANVSSVVTNNKFNLGGDETWAVFFGDVSNTHVSANRFTGNGSGAVFVSGLSPVSGWTITANLGLASFTSTFAASGADVLLGANTSNCIVGPGQGVVVSDQGSNNSNLSSADATLTSIRAPVTQAAKSGFNEQRIGAHILRHLRTTRELVNSP